MVAPLASMTGFARAQGEAAGTSWIWELRSVNGRGLDIKLRLPAGLDVLEPALRVARVKDLAIALADDIPGALPPRAELLLALPGVMRGSNAQDDSEETQAQVQEAVRAGFHAALADLAAARAGEGAKLAVIVMSLLDEISLLHGQAAAEAATQPELHMARLRGQLAEILGATPGLPEDRLAQEIALLATKSDVREELDRLAAHIAAARALLSEAGAIGRRFDFLVQEFNREANTLCSKSASLPLTACGLKMKAVIEQLREQAANIE
jgi:uncharacterized protein (TIGR00255 family)